jgi:hypothetical protein
MRQLANFEEDIVMFNCKKIMSLALTGALAFTMAAPAFAVTKDANSTVVTGTYQETTIDVTVPSTGTVTINPYGLDVEVTKSDSSTKVKFAGQQILSAPMYIANNSKYDLTVNASITTKVNTGLTLAAESLASSDSTDKSAFVYFQMVAIDGAEGKSAAKDVNDAAIDACAADATWTSADQLVLDSTKAVTTTEDTAVTLKAATTPAVAASGEGDSAVAATPATYAKGSVAVFRLAGDCIQSPATAWAAKDGFTATIAFTFTPGNASTAA